MTEIIISIECTTFSDLLLIFCSTRQTHSHCNRNNYKNCNMMGTMIQSKPAIFSDFWLIFCPVRQKHNYCNRSNSKSCNMMEIMCYCTIPQMRPPPPIPHRQDHPRTNLCRCQQISHPQISPLRQALFVIPNTKKDGIYFLSKHTSFFSSLCRYLIGFFVCFYPYSASAFLITFLT